MPDVDRLADLREWRDRHLVVRLDDPRIRDVEVQTDCATWNEIGRLAVQGDGERDG